MLLFLNNEKIIGYLPNENMTDDNRKQALDNGAVEYDGELNFKNGYDLYYRNGEIVYEEIIEPKQPETQLDRIENAVNDIAKNNTSYAEMAQAIAEGVNDIE